MGYLYPTDYNKAIQDVSLQQIISGDRSLLSMGELFARELITSHLVQKYQIDQEFTETAVYNPAAIYKAANRVYLDAAAYNTLSTYNEGNLCLQGGKVYICIQDISIPETFTQSNWELIGNQYDLYFVSFPRPVLNIQSYYKRGTQVFWKNHIYTALSDTWTYDHQTLLQFGRTVNIPYRNYFPDDSASGQKQWKDEGEYSVSGEDLLTAFTKGDNRNQQMVQYAMDIMIYRIYSRVAPKNIPEVRVDNYNIALMWLKGATKGDITANLPKIQPPQGKRIRWGSNIKQQNSY